MGTLYTHSHIKNPISYPVHFGKSNEKSCWRELHLVSAFPDFNVIHSKTIMITINSYTKLGFAMNGVLKHCVCAIRNINVSYRHLLCYKSFSLQCKHVKTYSFLLLSPYTVCYFLSRWSRIQKIRLKSLRWRKMLAVLKLWQAQKW